MLSRLQCHIMCRPMNTSTIHDTAIQACATHRDLAAFQQLAHSSLPILLGLAGHYLDQHQPTHREAVCRDTLLLAWRNLPDNNVFGHKTPSLWLYRIFGSVLYNRLVAIHKGETGLISWLETQHPAPIAMVDSPTGPRPAGFRAAPLAELAEHTPAVPPSQQLQQDLERLIQAEIDQCSAPLTPTGERVYPPLYHAELHSRMQRSRAAFRFKEGFKRCLGRPLEDWLLQRWLDDKPGSAALERQGLPRRSVEAYLSDQLDIEIDPAILHRGLSYPKSFPDRKQRRKVSNLFLWPGDWDLPTPALSETHRNRFINDIWRHRLDLTGSDNYAELTAQLERGQPLRLHHQGILLNSPERILSYLDQYRLYMEDMSCFGFKNELGKDRLGIVIDRDGGLIKSNKGLHRIAMAQTLGIQRATVTVRAIHQLWWQQQKGSATGSEAMKRISEALALVRQHNQ